VLSSPFDEYAEADVTRSWRASTRGQTPLCAAVVRLAHALDATQVLDAARQYEGANLGPGAPLEQLTATVEIAELCSWSDVRAAVDLILLEGLQAPPRLNMSTAQLAVSDAEAVLFCAHPDREMPDQARCTRLWHPRRQLPALARQMPPCGARLDDGPWSQIGGDCPRCWRRVRG
jgi:hypothetical protein